MSETEDWRVILESLDSLKQLIIDQFGENKERTIREVRRSVNAPAVDCSYFENRIDDIKELLFSKTELSLQEISETLSVYSSRIDKWKNEDSGHLVKTDNSNRVTLSLLLLLDDLERFINKKTKPILPEFEYPRLNKIRREISSLERNKDEQEKRLGNVKESLDLIIEAREAALKLPETLDSLRMANQTIETIKENSEISRKAIEDIEKFARDTEDALGTTRAKIISLVDKAETALRVSTGAGLAGAFAHNAKQLKISSRCWMVALVLSLLFAVKLGYCRMSAILEMIKTPNLDSALIWANIGMSFVLLVAPMWVAWIAAKRIAHLFRLIEDYEFKAAVSMSYEGYSREAAKYEGSDLSERVLKSALTRFDEPPLRFVETKDSGHPFLEMLERLFSAKWRVQTGDKKANKGDESAKVHSE